MQEWSIGQEAIKSLLSCGRAIVVLLIGWLVGTRFTYWWNLRQKQRESELSAAKQFYFAYGEFFATWKLWNRLDRSSGEAEDRRWMLYQRAAGAEAIIEGLMVKLSAEFNLTREDVERLGSFRQGFQRLRESIRLDKNLPWNSSSDPEYVAFKGLAVSTSIILLRKMGLHHQDITGAKERLLRITSNDFEGAWQLNIDEEKQTLFERGPRGELGSHAAKID